MGVYRVNVKCIVYRERIVHIVQCIGLTYSVKCRVQGVYSVWCRVRECIVYGVEYRELLKCCYFFLHKFEAKKLFLHKFFISFTKMEIPRCPQTAARLAKMRSANSPPLSRLVQKVWWPRFRLSADYLQENPQFHLLTKKMYTLHAEQYNICTVYVQYMFNICTFFEQYLYNIYTKVLQYIFNRCTKYV